MGLFEKSIFETISFFLNFIIRDTTKSHELEPQRKVYVEKLL
jgi:hypothetical protein